MSDKRLVANRGMQLLILAILLMVGCDQCPNTPEVAQVRSVCKQRQMHLHIWQSGEEYYVFIWPSSEGSWGTERWAYTGSNGDLTKAIAEARRAMDADYKTYLSSGHTETLCDE
jgi:hypothetical protein